MAIHNEDDVVQYLVCWLFRRKASVRIPGQASKRKYEKKKKNISSASSS